MRNYRQNSRQLKILNTLPLGFSSNASLLYGPKHKLSRLVTQRTALIGQAKYTTRRIGLIPTNIIKWTLISLAANFSRSMYNMYVYTSINLVFDTAYFTTILNQCRIG